MHEDFDFAELKFIIFGHDGMVIVVVEEHYVVFMFKAISFVVWLVGHLSIIITEFKF